MRTYKTQDYHIELVESKEDSRQLYGIVSNDTGVTEYEDMILPRTIDALSNLQELLDKALEDFNTIEPLQLTLVGIGNDDNPEGSLH